MLIPNRTDRPLRTHRVACHVPVGALALAAAIACSLAACAQSVETTEIDQTLSCEYRRYPCNPYDGDGDWTCSWACGYTAHCREYSLRELQLCAEHPDQVISLAPYLYCNRWGSPTWDTWCEPTLLASPPAPNRAE